MADNCNDIFEKLRQAVLTSELDEQDKESILKNLNQKLNIMITGATGSGKNSTINALFDANVSKVGIGVDPETMDIQKYTLKNLILWDSPGLGDSTKADARHAENIIKKLKETDSNGNALIDLVLVILDGSTRDYETSYKLIKDVIIKNLGENVKDRILVAINQCDMAMKGRHWDYTYNRPDDTLENFLREQAESVKNRIKESTGVNIITPVCYSAEYGYNVDKLMDLIIDNIPLRRREMLPKIAFAAYRILGWF